MTDKSATVGTLRADDKAFRDACIRRAKQSFKFFFKSIWRISIEKIDGVKFEHGKHIDKWCDLWQDNPYICLKGPRKHLKSSIAKAYVAWMLFNLEDFRGQYYEVWYFSFTYTQAAEHTEKINKYISVNPYFAEFKRTTDAKSIIEYRKGNKVFRCLPEGMFGASRGRHPDGVICDDILRDTSIEKGGGIIDLGQLRKITKLFKDSIISLPKEKTGWLKLIGTPQDEKDIFNEVKKLKRFICKDYKAVIDWNKKIVLWPELLDFTRLMEIRSEEIGPKSFEKEYQCSPARMEEMYFSRTTIEGIADMNKNYELKELMQLKSKGHPIGPCVAGFDIGKKRHPSHLTILKVILPPKGDHITIKNTRCEQIVSKWYDFIDYDEQIKSLKEYVGACSLEYMIYDNTRAEFEGYAERGELPDEMIPISFSSTMKYQAAGDLDTGVNGKLKGSEEKRLKILNEERYVGQILNCDNNLKSMETADGHGEGFWTLALAWKAYLKYLDDQIDYEEVAADSEEMTDRETYDGGDSDERETANQDW